ncbi:MAG TPA: aspartate 1-decarboxylase [Candidatus Omnitrophota bacterium]|nr:aspartate 1-decarboxylase [Candidatus Omnitrophota bacterium]HRK61895.1 aspartate 1-decarboxylase [Candidatus Omnitrophota bacterium]
MQRQILGGKIQRVTVTEAKVDYEGSVTIDETLMKAAGFVSFEKVTIANLTNGARMETYAIPGPAGSGKICLNGGCAKHGKPGDMLIVMTFVVLDEKELTSHHPLVVSVDAQNKLVKTDKASIPALLG